MYTLYMENISKERVVLADHNGALVNIRPTELFFPDTGG